MLRPATDADASAIAEIYISSRRTHIPYAPLAHTVEETRGWIRDVLVPSGGVIVGEQDAAVVAFVAVSHHNGTSFLDQMYVSPDKVGQGIGSALLRHVIANARLPMRLFTFAANARARAFYETFAFSAIEFSDGADNEEHCPDVLYELRAVTSSDR